jgi:hypothetical protein
MSHRPTSDHRYNPSRFNQDSTFTNGQNLPATFRPLPIHDEQDIEAIKHKLKMRELDEESE